MILLSLLLQKLWDGKLSSYDKGVPWPQISILPALYNRHPRYLFLLSLRLNPVAKRRIAHVVALANFHSLTDVH